MLRSRIKMGFRDFNAGMKRLTEQVFIKRAKKGLGKAGIQLMFDTIFGVPSTPLLDGPLRGSGSVFVNNMLVKMSEYGFPDYVAVSCSIPRKPGEIKAVIVFNAPYAARWHENWPPKGSFTEPTAGIKYMEQKMIANNKKYFYTIVESIRRG